MTKIVSIETRLNQKIQEAEIPNNYLDNLPITKDFSTGHSHYLKIQVERMPKVPGSNPHSGLQNYLTLYLYVNVQSSTKPGFSLVEKLVKNLFNVYITIYNLNFENC